MPRPAILVAVRGAIGNCVHCPIRPDCGRVEPGGPHESYGFDAGRARSGRHRRSSLGCGCRHLRPQHHLERGGVAMLGPKRMGRATPGFPPPWIRSLCPAFVAGSVATLLQSGSIGVILVSLGPRIGFRTVVSAGNETMTDVADMTAYFAD